MEILDIILKNNSSNFIDKKRENFLIKKENITFVGEIKGVSQAVANKHVSQLDVHVQSYIDDITEKGLKENVKGLLIINHQRDKFLEKKIDTQKIEKIFTENVGILKKTDLKL